jgi:GT2 family glycosyltransferase
VTPAPTVLVVAYRSDDHLGECLRGLEPSSVLVIDNGASEATRALVATCGARYVAAPGNVGFAAAVNLGLSRDWNGQDDVLLLNPDARIDAAGVRSLQDALHAPGTRRAAVGPQLLGFDGTPQRASWPLPSPAQVWFDALGLSRLWRGRRFVVGAVLLLNGSALAALGGLDERYFLYAEEADWQLRAQRAGWTVAVVDGVIAQHEGGASTTDSAVREQLFHRSAELFARRWYGRFGWLVMRAGSLVAAARRSVAGPPERRRLNRRTFALYVRGPAGARASSERTA